MSPIARRHHGPLSHALRALLLEGRCLSRPNFDFDVYMLHGAVIRAKFEELAPLWTIRRDELLPAWIAEHPGTRPAAWWWLEAREPRQVLEDRGHHVWPVPRWGETWRLDRGRPNIAQLGHFEVVFEAEATYLRRLDLLTSAELSALDDADFTPEILRVDADTLEEIVARRAAREKGRPV
jgi:hypothetical protein